MKRRTKNSNVLYIHNYPQKIHINVKKNIVTKGVLEMCHSCPPKGQRMEQRVSRIWDL